MFAAFEVAGADREVGNNTLQLYVSDGLTTWILDGSGKKISSRPCQDGDVLSVQPGNLFEGRVKGTAGPYEVYTLCSKGYLYNPDHGYSYIVPNSY